MEEDISPKRLLSLGETVAARGESRVGVWQKREAAAEDGWTRIRVEDKTTKVTFVAPDCDSERIGAILDVTNDATPCNLFERVFPFLVMETKLAKLREEGNEVGAFADFFL